MNLILRYSLRLLLVRYQYLLLASVLLLIGGASAFGLRYLSASNFLIGLCLLPMVIFIEGRQRINYGYLISMTVFAILAYVYHIKLFYFFSIALGFIVLIELFLGRVNPLVLFLILLMSPVFLQVAVILGFPIRLHLSELAGAILSFAGLDIRVEGNLMVMNGFNFTVDEACMGLNMLAISMLMGVFILSYRYRTIGKKLSWSSLGYFFLAVFVLNIIANLFRIVALVLFRILPENPLHEIIGIAGLIVYVMLPLYAISRWLTDRFGIPFESNDYTIPVASRMGALAVSVSALMMLIGFTINPGRVNDAVPHAQVKLMDLAPVDLQGGITKLSNNQLLVYVKPINEFFSGEHTPLLCWKGSGYQFARITKEQVNGRDIYFGVLEKNGTSELHTAWWYTNGSVHTIDQLEWRSSMAMGGKRFCLVNVTAENKTILQEQLQSMFSDKLLTITP